MMKRRSFLGSTATLAAAATLPGRSIGADLAPFKLYDTHAHFYSNEPDKYPFNASGARYGPERMIAKAMAKPMNPQTVFAFWDSIGVELGTGVQYNSTYGTDNSYLLDVSAQHPDRIIPVVILSPTDAATAPTLQTMARDSRIAAVRFSGSPNAEGEAAFLSDAAQDTWASADALGLSVVLMPLGPNIPQALVRIAQHADRYPNVRIVLDHIAFPRPELLPQSFGLTPQHRALVDHRNIYYKYTNLLISEMEVGAQAAGKPLVDLKDFLHHMVDTFGADHMVWGSDYGNVEVDDVAYVQRALASAEGLSLAQQKAIFYDTAKAVFVPGGKSAGA